MQTETDKRHDRGVPNRAVDMPRPWTTPVPAGTWDNAGRVAPVAHRRLDSATRCPLAHRLDYGDALHDPGRTRDWAKVNTVH
jgi:hypothetical protein